MTDSYISDWTVTFSDPNGGVDAMIEFCEWDCTENQAIANGWKIVNNDPEMVKWDFFDISDDNDPE